MHGWAALQGTHHGEAAVRAAAECRSCSVLAAGAAYRVLEPRAKDRGNRGGAYLVLNWAERRLAAANGAAERRWPELGKKGGCGI